MIGCVLDKWAKEFILTFRKRLAHIKALTITLASYAAIVGVAAYNNLKLKKEASRVVSTDEPAQSIPLVSSPTSNK